MPRQQTKKQTMKTTSLKVKSGNFTAIVSGELSNEKLQELVDIGVQYVAEAKGFTPQFKGVKARSNVAFSVERATTMRDAVMKGLTPYFTGKVTVEVVKRDWSAAAGGKQAEAQRSYDAMLKVGLGVDQALAVAKQIHPEFVPQSVGEALAGEQKAEPIVEGATADDEPEAA